jgi:hypothetical protein
MVGSDNPNGEPSGQVNIIVFLSNSMMLTPLITVESYLHVFLYIGKVHSE